jgi:DeoR/GlpR family transcriptional regulator of sugar metabolism
MESKLSNVERWRGMIERVNRHSVSVSEQVREFAVSEMTVRRDLAGLAQQGRILGVHGGAIAKTLRRQDA